VIKRLLEYLVEREHKAVHSKMVQLYPNREDRAAAYFATGATELEIERFGEGNALEAIMVTKTEDGWMIEYVDADELEEA